MIGNLVRVPEHVRASLHADPERISALLYPDFEEEEPAKKPGFFSRLFGHKSAERSKPKTILEPIGENDSLDIDKTWHVLHFLFTGFAWDGEFPAGFLVSCGETVGDVDVGYGPARSFTPQEVKQISEFLMNLDPVAVRNRLKPAQMKELEIYPGPWKGDERMEEEWPYFEGGLKDTLAFVKEAAQKDLALLVYIN